MKKLLEFWKSYEQVLLFTLLIIYLNGFCFIFEDEMREGTWVTGLFLIQFFGLTYLLALRINKIGGKLPKDIKDTH